MNIKAVNGGCALAGRDEGRQHLHGCGLAGAIGPEKTQNFAFVDVEAHVVQGFERAVKLRNATRFNHAGVETSLGTELSAILLRNPRPKAAKTSANSQGFGQRILVMRDEIGKVLARDVRTNLAPAQFLGTLEDGAGHVGARVAFNAFKPRAAVHFEQHRPLLCFKQIYTGNLKPHSC